MPFGLNNVGVTYKHFMNNIVKGLIGHTMEIHVDDTLIKSFERAFHLLGLEQCFKILLHYNIPLNPTKCTFRVTSIKFFGCIVTHKEFEVVLEMIKSHIKYNTSK